MKWNRRKKLLGLIALSLVIFGVAFVITNFYKPNGQVGEPFWINIKGNITPALKDYELKERPPFVRAFQYPHNPERLCSGKELSKPVPINWINNGSTGTYELPIQMPIDMPVILTTDCDACDPITLYTNRNENSYSQNLVWGGQACKKDIEADLDPKRAFKRAIQLLAFISRDVEEKEIYNSSDIKIVKDNLGRGWGEIGEIDYEENNHTLMKSYRALYYAWRADYNLQRVNLKECIDDFEALSEATEGCYAIPPERIQIFKSSNSTYSQFRSWLGDNYYEEEDIEDIKKDIRGVYNSRNGVRESTYECEGALATSKREFETASSSCNIEETKSGLKALFGGGFLLLLAIFVELMWKVKALAIAFYLVTKEYIKDFIVKILSLGKTTTQTPTQSGSGIQKVQSAEGDINNLDQIISHHGSGDQVNFLGKVYNIYQDKKSKKKPRK